MIFPENLYDRLIDEAAKGNVTVQHGPGELVQFTYSRDCMFDRNWNEVTKLARGIIFDSETKELVALPFPKFFNYGEETYSLPDEPFTVATKEDGSMVIVFYYKGTWHTATKGAFFSDQAVEARKLLQESVDISALNPNVTYLVEYVSPNNQIVIRYEKPELVLIGEYGIYNHEEIFPLENIPGLRVVSSHEFSSVDDIVRLCKSLPGDQEGFVVRFSSGYRVKIKGDEYIKLHKLLSGFNQLRVWEVMRDCINVMDFAKDLPEEFHEEFFKWANYYEDRFNMLYFDVETMHYEHESKTDKELGLWIKEQRAIAPHRAHDFLFLARKKNWLVDSRTKPEARKSAFDLFRPKNPIKLGKYVQTQGPSTEG